MVAWTLFAASVGVGVGGAILLAVGVDDVNSVENASDGTRWEDVRESYDRAPIFTGTGLAVMSLGVAGLLVSAALLAVYGEGGTWIEATIGPGGLGVRGRF